MGHNVNFILNNINKFGKLRVIKPTNLIIQKVSHDFPYDRTFGNPFIRTPIFNVKIIKNTVVYFSYKKSAYLIETSCKNESLFLLNVINSKLYQLLIKKHNVSIMFLKFPEYNKFHNHNNIDDFLNMYFYL